VTPVGKIAASMVAAQKRKRSMKDQIIKKDARGKYRFQIKNAVGTTLAISARGYTNRDDAVMDYKIARRYDVAESADQKIAIENLKRRLSELVAEINELTKTNVELNEAFRNSNMAKKQANSRAEAADKVIKNLENEVEKLISTEFRWRITWVVLVAALVIAAITEMVL